MPRIKEIGHAVIYVSNPAASAKWYCDVLGMEVVIEEPRFPGFFLSFGERDHDLALFKAPEGRKLGRDDYNHLAMELDGGVEDLKAFRRRLVDKGIEITGTVDHGISYGVYFLDPDGHQLEVFHQRTRPGEDKIQAFKVVGAKSTPIELDSVG